MKLMKRILAIVCTFVMIISMATGVNAVDNTSTTVTSTQKEVKLQLQMQSQEKIIRFIRFYHLKAITKLQVLIHIRNLVEIGIHLLTQMKVNSFLLQMKTVM